ncbi:hypothetical protein, partial [Paenibacillus hemerocallicola]|uniref:hypothetical protein n=1 Tax=Paenibacillus hemerocallicola TaxID=1172614 RepID=UPI001C406A21
SGYNSILKSAAPLYEYFPTPFRWFFLFLTFSTTWGTISSAICLKRYEKEANGTISSSIPENRTDFARQIENRGKKCSSKYFSGS